MTRRVARSLPRFFIEGTRSVGEEVALDEPDARKIRLVLRLRDGDSIETVDSAGAAYRGVLSFAGDSARAYLAEAIARVSEPALRIVLAQGIPKGQKMDFVVEKITEIGVAGIVPFFSARSIGERVGAAKVERWRRLARSAAQQSGRRSVPGVEDPLAWEALLDRLAGFDRVLVAWEVAQHGALLERLASWLTDVRSVAVVIGPEGGLTHAEVDAAAARGAEVISLGPRILRTETAGLVACTALLLAAGEM